MRTMPLEFSYVVNVYQRSDGSWLAHLNEPSNPLAGHGSTPLEAVRARCETIRRWPLGGAEEWLESAGASSLKSKFNVNN